MKEFRFLQGEPPEDFRLQFTYSLFNSAEHRHLQSDENWISFFILSEENKSIIGALHLHLNNRKAESPYRAPFGSFEFSEDVSPPVLHDFILFVDNALINIGVEAVRIKMPPSIYSPHIAMMQVLLIARGYQVEMDEVGTVIHISEVEFKKRIKDSERQVLSQYHRQHFVCTRVPVDEVKKVYDFISHHHSLKGYTLSMTFDQLQKVIDTFRSNFFLFVVLDQEKIIAASVSIRVTDHVLYNFYITHDAAYKKFSPVIAIIEALYNFCNERGIPILDLGTSMLHGEPNFPLLDFKRRLGGVITEKFTLQKKLT